MYQNRESSRDRSAVPVTTCGWRSPDSEFPPSSTPPPVWSWSDASPGRLGRQPLQRPDVADTLVLDLRDGQSYFLESLFSLLENYEWGDCWNNKIPLPIMMFQRYMDTYPDKLEDLCNYSEQASLLCTKLVQACLVNELEQVQFLKFTCASPKICPKLWIELLEAVPNSVFVKAVPSLAHQIGNTTKPLFADLLNSAAERVQKKTVERLIAVAMKSEMRALRMCRTGSEEVNGEEFRIDAATIVLKKMLGNLEISGKAIGPAVDVLIQYDPDPLRVDLRIKEKCGVELAEEKGPAFSAVAVKLFHEGCNRHHHNRQEMIKFLAVRKHIGDYTLKAIVTKEGQDVLTKDVIMACAGNGYACTSCELSLQSSKILSSSNEQTFLHILTHAQDARVALAAFTQLTPDLYSIDCIDRHSNNVLHLAGMNGLTALTKLILDHDQGYIRLLWAKNLKCEYPVQVSLSKRNYATAAVMLRAMNDWRLFVSTKQSKPIMNFQDLLIELSWAKTSKKLSALNFKECLPKQFDYFEQENQENQGDPGALLPTNQKKQQIEECILAILDSTIDRHKGLFHYEILEADQNGCTPEQDKSNPYGMTGYNPIGPNCIEIVAKQDLEEVAGHDSFRSLIKLKWKLYGWKLYLIVLLLYLFFLTILTVSLTLAADKQDPSDYSTSLDMFRLFCEALVLLTIFVDIALEVIDFCTNYDRRLKVYFSDWTNWLDMLAIITTFLIIPFRFMNSDTQWIFSSLTYVFHGMRVFEYAIILRFFGVHVEVLVRVIIQDLSQFMLVFAVFMVTLGGGLFLALRGNPCTNLQNVNVNGTGFDKAINTSLCLYPDETKTLFRSWFTGIRLLAEGETVISPYVFGDEGFRGLAALLYLVWLFLVIVILLNLLIAQFTTSYEEELSKARVSVTLNRAKALSRMWNPLWMKVIIRSKERLKKFVRFSYYKPTSTIYDLEDEDKAVKQFEEVNMSIQTSTKALHKHLTEMQTTMTNKMQNELRDQSHYHTAKEDQSETINELQREVKEQATVIKQQSVVMEELQAAIMKQTQMFNEQQILMRETWTSVAEMKQTLQCSIYQT